MNQYRLFTGGTFSHRHVYHYASRHTLCNQWMPPTTVNKAPEWDGEDFNKITCYRCMKIYEEKLVKNLKTDLDRFGTGEDEVMA